MKKRSPPGKGGLKGSRKTYCKLTIDDLSASRPQANSRQPRAALTHRRSPCPGGEGHPVSVHRTLSPLLLGAARGRQGRPTLYDEPLRDRHQARPRPSLAPCDWLRRPDPESSSPTDAASPTRGEAKRPFSESKPKQKGT
jgi:hypothetical protein